MYDAEYPHQCLGGWKSSDGLRLDPRVKFQPQRNYCSLGEKNMRIHAKCFALARGRELVPENRTLRKT
jgi:hypothetical protein